MKLINQKCFALPQQYSNNSEEYLTLMYQHIEKCGRTCYHSSDKITSESAKPFVDRMIKSDHTAMLEHGTIYLHFTYTSPTDDSNYMRFKDMERFYNTNKYSKVNHVLTKSYQTDVYVTTNLRVVVENHLEEDLQYICEPTEYHEKRYTLACTTALHCYKDLTRHRVFSFAIESTRYCNYTKDKFGSELTFIIPTWLDKMPEGSYKWNSQDYSWNPNWEDGPTENEQYQYMTGEYYLTALEKIENIYFTLIREGWQAQQAAEVLPQCIKGDMIITGFESDWKHLLDLRYYGTTGAPHPMVKELATLMKEELEKLGFNY